MNAVSQSSVSSGAVRLLAVSLSQCYEAAPVVEVRTKAELSSLSNPAREPGK